LGWPAVVQQGSFWAQMGTCTPVFVVPAGNQQQQPPQSIHVATCGSAPHMHAPPSPPPASAEPPALLLELLELLLSELPDVLLLLELVCELGGLLLFEVLELTGALLLELAGALLLLELAGLLLLVLLLSDALFCALLSLGMPPPPLLLLHAARPTVDDAPMTTMT